ncbi:MAG: leucine-rich repeat protein [Oscillospiraceae bacterium]|jgi:hypothetical protein|nr:leucine-rich repeat protein [Oscillospiraceae bacterium]
MKKLFSLITVFVFMSGMLASFLITAEDVENKESVDYSNALGIWKGSYGSNTDHGLDLSIYQDIQGELKALFSFYPLENSNAKSGQYICSVSVSDNIYNFTGETWIQRPSGYVYHNFKGSFDENGYTTLSDDAMNLEKITSKLNMTTLDDVLGTWQGHYYASQGKTSATITCELIDNELIATREFYYDGTGNSVGTASGKWVGNLYLLPSKQIYIDSTKWIENPNGWVLVEYFGTLSNNVFSGYCYHLSETYPDAYFERISTVALSQRNLVYYDDFEEVNKTASVYWGGELFSGDSRTIESENPAYYENLAKVGAILSQGAYDIPNNNEVFSTESLPQKNLELLGFTNIKAYNGGKISYPAHIFAAQEITVNGEKQDLVLVDIRGTDAKEDLWTDIVLSYATGFYPKEHPGFATARDNILSELPTYLFDIGINPANAKILITGHSYGAAVANLLSKSLEDTFSPEDIYGYTYASPNNIVVETRNNDISSATNIHNYRNTNDIITKVPGATAINELYTIYGNKHNFTAQNYNGYLKDHNMTTYINYVLSMDSGITVTPQSSTLTHISGSADVTVTSENGEVLGSITGGIADENSQIPMIQIGGETYILDTDISTSTTEKSPIKINITPTSSENVSVGIIGYDSSGEISNQKTYTDIPTDNSEIVVNIPADNSENPSLEKVDEEGNVTPIEEDKNTEPDPTEPIISSNIDYEYIIMPDNTITLTSYIGTETDISIPTEIDGIPVTKIESGLLSKNIAQSIFVPNTIQYLGFGAFQSTALLKAVFEDGYSGNISEQCFGWCMNIEEITIPETVTEFGGFAFWRCEKLTVCGYSGSAVEEYVLNSNQDTEIKFVALKPKPIEVNIVKLVDDGTDEVNVNDLELLIQIVMYIDLPNVTSEQISNADVYKDGKLDVCDIAIFKRYLLKSAMEQIESNG